MKRTVLAGTLVVVASLLAAAAALLPAPTIEAWYARGLYPAVTRGLVPLTSASPLPLSVVVLGSLLLLFVVGLMRALMRRRGLAKRLLEASAGLALMVIWFYLTWGFNYGRLPAADLLALPPTEATAERWSALADHLGTIVAQNAAAEPDVGAAISAVALSLEQLTEQLTTTRVELPSRVRWLPGGTLLASGFSGMVSPFSLEAHVDAGLPAAARVAVAAHELAHLAGFAGEADAELLAAVAGLQAPHPYARYATALAMWSRVAARLPADQRSAMLNQLPERARDDLEQSRNAALTFRRDGLAAVVTALYDRYLRSQRVAAGIGAYDQAAVLLLQAYAGGRLTSPALPAD